MKEQNCAKCKNLEIMPVANMCVVGCAATGKVIPHKADNGDDGRGPITITCWRIPMSCPRSDDEVQKREDKAPRKTWTTFEHQIS
ncbi:MAG: hypothetical protein AAF662_10035 [Pseudomonadota bacterium]